MRNHRIKHRSPRRRCHQPISILLGLMLAGLIAHPAYAEQRQNDNPTIQPGDSIVVAKATVLRVEDDVVAEVDKGEQFVVKQVQGNWLWVDSETSGWIDRDSVVLARTIEAAQAKANATATVVGDQKTDAQSPNGDYATAVARAVVIEDEPQPTHDETAAQPRSPRFNFSFGGHRSGFGFGIGGSPRRGSSIRLRFGGRSDRNHRHHRRPHRRRHRG